MNSDGRVQYRRHPNGLVLAMQDGRLVASDWDRFLTLVRAHRTDTPPLCLVRSHGSYPDAAQRRALMDAIGLVNQPRARVGVLVDSMVARAAVTAMSWVTPGFQAFRPNDTASALHYLGVTGRPATEMVRVLEELEAELGLRESARSAQVSP